MSVGMPGLPRRSEVHVFVLWSKARVQEQRILDDIATHFTVLDLVEVEWSAGEIFARNLTRMYGDSLPPDSDKERHCGSGRFLAVVVEVRRPRYRIRRTSRGPQFLNADVFDARKRYRSWTGGGHKVHASDSVTEADRNLVLLLGRRGEHFRTLAGPGANRPQAARLHDADPVGTAGWTTVDELVLAIAAYGGDVVPPHPEATALTVRTSDVWWTEHIAGGRTLANGVREVHVAGAPLHLHILEVAAPLRARLNSAIRRLARRRHGG